MSRTAGPKAGGGEAGAGAAGALEAVKKVSRRLVIDLVNLSAVEQR
jgi:hypothetical protein